jgi:hypothetical protein
VDVEVEVVPVGGVVCVDVVVVGGVVCVEVLVGGVVCVEVDVLIGDRLDVGPSVVAPALGGSVVGDTLGVRDGRVGTEIVRETLGRLEPPPHDDANATSAKSDAIGSARNARPRSPLRVNRQAATAGLSRELVSPRSTPSP